MYKDRTTWTSCAESSSPKTHSSRVGPICKNAGRWAWPGECGPCFWIGHHCNLDQGLSLNAAVDQWYLQSSKKTLLNIVAHISCHSSFVMIPYTEAHHAHDPTLTCAEPRDSYHDAASKSFPSSDCREEGMCQRMCKGQLAAQQSNSYLQVIDVFVFCIHFHLD